MSTDTTISPAKRAEIEVALQAEVDVFLRRWGDIGWRGMVGGVEPVNNPELLRLVRGVAAIEDDAFYMQTKLARTGVLRWPSIRQFNAVWLTEESDHGRAFDVLYRQLGGAEHDRARLEHDTMSRDRRAILALPVMRAASPFRRASLGGYVVRGAMVEHVAIAVYGALKRELLAMGATTAADIVRRILMQEGRHLRFFTRAAKVVLGSTPVAAKVVRRVTEATWRPPGVDLYGTDHWADMFLPVLTNPQTRDELAGVDAKLGAIPGFEGSAIVARYLDRVVRQRGGGSSVEVRAVAAEAEGSPDPLTVGAAASPGL
jgi:hypothetical protein